MTAPAYTCRSTLLKKFAKSAKHAKAFIDGGGTDENLSLRLGLGTHALLFEDKPVVVYAGGVMKTEKVKKPRKKPGDDESAEAATPSIARIVSRDPFIVEMTVEDGEREGREFTKKEYTDVRSGALWETFKADRAGAIILNEKERAIAEAMATAIRNDSDADRLLFAKGTRHEHRIEWEMKGRRCSAIIDAFGPDDGDALVDLKSTVDASPAKFPWQAKKLGYCLQLAFYAAGLELAGYGRREPYIVAVENAPPFCVQVYKLTAADIDEGRWAVDAAMDQLLECERTGYWPSYADKILPLNVRNLPAPVVEEEDENPWDVSSSDDVAA